MPRKAPRAGWDPAKYLEFAGPRVRPALDLLARVTLAQPGWIYDLGCGTGNVTRLLTERWPHALVTGVDGSDTMLARAAESGLRVRWMQAELAAWRALEPADLVFSNAALHWLDDHQALFPRLVAELTPGGVLAVQMPRNHHAPSHTEMMEVARTGPWRERLASLLRPAPVAEPVAYQDLLASRVSRIDIWETEYLHVLEGEAPVVEWLKGSALKPLLDALDDRERARFLEAYTARIRAAYPPRADGRTLFPFRRLFIVATR